MKDGLVAILAEGPTEASPSANEKTAKAPGDPTRKGKGQLPVPAPRVASEGGASSGLAGVSPTPRDATEKEQKLTAERKERRKRRRTSAKWLRQGGRLKRSLHVGGCGRAFLPKVFAAKVTSPHGEKMVTLGGKLCDHPQDCPVCAYEKALERRGQATKLFKAWTSGEPIPGAREGAKRYVVCAALTVPHPDRLPLARWGEVFDLLRESWDWFSRRRLPLIKAAGLGWFGHVKVMEVTYGWARTQEGAGGFAGSCHPHLHMGVLLEVPEGEVPPGELQLSELIHEHWNLAVIHAARKLRGKEKSTLASPAYWVKLGRAEEKRLRASQEKAYVREYGRLPDAVARKAFRLDNSWAPDVVYPPYVRDERIQGGVVAEYCWSVEKFVEYVTPDTIDGIAESIANPEQSLDGVACELAFSSTKIAAKAKAAKAHAERTLFGTRYTWTELLGLDGCGDQELEAFAQAAFVAHSRSMQGVRAWQWSNIVVPDPVTGKLKREGLQKLLEAVAEPDNDQPESTITITHSVSAERFDRAVGRDEEKVHVALDEANRGGDLRKADRWHVGWWSVPCPEKAWAEYEALKEDSLLSMQAGRLRRRRQRPEDKDEFAGARMADEVLRRRDVLRTERGLRVSYRGLHMVVPEPDAADGDASL